MILRSLCYKVATLGTSRNNRVKRSYQCVSKRSAFILGWSKRILPSGYVSRLSRKIDHSLAGVRNQRRRPTCPVNRVRVEIDGNHLSKLSPAGFSRLCVIRSVAEFEALSVDDTDSVTPDVTKIAPLRFGSRRII